MLRRVTLLVFLVFLMGLMHTGCRVRYDEPGPKDPADTTDLSEPGTGLSDTLRIRNPDSLLAASARFGGEDVFSQSSLETRTGVYHTANDFIGRAVTLKYSFTAPAGDTLKYRPFVLMVHEGAFLYGGLENELGKANLLSRKGYATASISYRIGFNGGSESNACGGNTREVVQAVYRAVQDTYAALHYFAARADEFGIDPGQMILAGSSAGAITVSALLYMNEADFEALLPGITKTLGRLDPDRSGSPFRVRAILSQLGYGVFKSGYIDAGNAVPTVFFQRTGDNVLPYQQGNLFYCPFYLPIEGARPVSQRLRKFNVPYELNYQTETGHQLSYPEDYITNRYALFVKMLWQGNLRFVTNDNYTNVEDLQIP